jgi:hypothetical protein
MQDPEAILRQLQRPDKPRLFTFGTPPPIFDTLRGKQPSRVVEARRPQKLDEYYRTHALDDPVVISQGRLPARVPIPPPENAPLVLDAVVPHRTTQARRISSVYASNRTGPSGLDICVQSGQLTSDPADDSQPAISPHGTLEAFRSIRPPRSRIRLPILIIRNAAPIEVYCSGPHAYPVTSANCSPRRGPARFTGLPTPPAQVPP